MRNSRENDSNCTRKLELMEAPKSVSMLLTAQGLGSFFLHSHFPWQCVTGPLWSFVSLRSYVSRVGWTDRYGRETEDRTVELKELHCLKPCPTGQSTAAHWRGTEEDSDTVGTASPEHQQNGRNSSKSQVKWGISESTHCPGLRG